MKMKVSRLRIRKLSVVRSRRFFTEDDFFGMCTAYVNEKATR